MTINRNVNRNINIGLLLIAALLTTGINVLSSGIVGASYDEDGNYFEDNYITVYPKQEQHLDCINGVCTQVDGPGDNYPGCTAIGGLCGATMCIWEGEYIVSPKVVGEQLEAGIYAKNYDGTPMTVRVYLKGYNPATAKWLTFADTIPDNTGWAGMPVITLTTAHIGTWRMSWDAPEISCGAQSGVPDLVITEVATPIYLASDKTSIQKGDTVTFSGIYKADARVGLWDVTDLLDNNFVVTTCDNNGNFEVAVNLDIPKGLREIQAKLIPDKSGIVYITVYPKQDATTTPTTTPPPP